MVILPDFASGGSLARGSFVKRGTCPWTPQNFLLRKFFIKKVPDENPKILVFHRLVSGYFFLL
jgi:hypothetical protein